MDSFIGAILLFGLVGFLVAKLLQAMFVEFMKRER